MAKDQNSNGNVEVFLEDVRCSHPHLFTPQAYKKDKNSKPRYSCAFILDKKKHKDQIADIEDAIEAAKDAKWPKGAPRIKEQNLCLIDGDDTDRDEYQGCMVLKSASPEKSPPTVLGRNKEPLDERSGKPYGGCYVNAIVRIYAYDEFSDQVNASLEAVQYFRKGESFGKGPADTSRFKDHGDDDDEEYTSMRGGGRGRDRDEDEPRRRSKPSRDEDEPRSRRSSRDEDEPRSRRSARDEDDEPAPRRRASRDEDDDEPAPRRRASRDDDDEPRSRRRSSRDDD